MSLGTILLIILVLFLIGALPRWPHTANWGYYPAAGWASCSSSSSSCCSWGGSSTGPRIAPSTLERRSDAGMPDP